MCPSRAATIAVALLFTSGCAAGRPADPVRIAPLPEEAANEPLPDPARETKVSLRGILAYALRNSPLLRVADAEARRADAELTAADVLLQNNPELAAGIGQRRVSGASGLEYEASISQRLEIAGERGLRRAAAQSARQRARIEIGAIRWTVHREIHTAFHAALVARERLDAARVALAFSKRLADIARKRRDAGDISDLDVQVAETELAQVRQAEIAAAGAYTVARLALAELAGWPAAEPPEPAGNLDPPRAPDSDEALLRLAVTAFPELAIRRARVLEEEARVRLADREAWPEPTIGLTYAQESEPAEADAARQHIGMVTLAVPLPLWNRNAGERARARAELAISKAEEAAVRRVLAPRVRRAAALVRAAAERIEAFGAEILPNMQRNLDLIGRAFELGEIDILEVLVARGRFLDAQRAALDAYEEYYRAIGELEAAVGRELWADEHDHAGGGR